MVHAKIGVRVDVSCVRQALVGRAEHGVESELNHVKCYQNKCNYKSKIKMEKFLAYDTNI